MYSCLSEWLISFCSFVHVTYSRVLGGRQVKETKSCDQRWLSGISSEYFTRCLKRNNFNQNTLVEKHYKNTIFK